MLLNAVAKARERCFTSDELKKLIKKQLSDDVIEWEEFDVGYINGKRGEKVISIKSQKNVAEVWKKIKV